ncbi:MAG: LysR family transcriptional regulator [Polyangiaceae bacterium]
MAAIDGTALDLNLLHALDVLLAERNVTRAASRLGLTQSSASHALGRLREALGDPLLVRSGRALVATPRAEALREPLSRALAELRRVVRHEGGFDPATSTRTFTLACPDLVVSVLPELMNALAAQAPRVRLDVRDRAAVDVPIALGSGAIDAALLPAPDVAEGGGLAQRILGRVTFAVLARRGHPALKRPWDLDAWLAHPHVVVRTGTSGPGFIGAALERAGKRRIVGMTAPTFLVAPFVVAESDFFFAAPRELSRGLARKLGLVMLELPLPVPKIPVAAVWHERMHADPGHAWFRERVAIAAKAVLQAGAGAPGLRPGPRTGKRGS